MNPPPCSLESGTLPHIPSIHCFNLSYRGYHRAAYSFGVVDRSYVDTASPLESKPFDRVKTNYPSLIAITCAAHLRT